MPTPDFSHDNTAPTAVAAASMAGTASEPTGVEAPDYAAADDAPAGIALAGLTPTDNAPGGVTPASYAGTGGAPTGIALAGLTPTGDEPTAKTVTIGGEPTASSPQQVAASTALQPITDANMHTATLTFLGKLKTEQPFGLYVPPAAGLVVGVQLSAQVAPTGADVIVELIDADDISLGRTATLPAGDSYAAVTFGTALPFLAGAIIRAHITQVGSGTAGSYLTANLFVQLN